MGENSGIQWTTHTFTKREKLNARALVNSRVRAGKMPRPDSLACTDCGHRATDDERHEYDHPRGYTGMGKLDVEAVCTKCHARRDSAKAKQTHCHRGHEFTPENTKRKTNGTRLCRTCARDRERARPPRGSAYWKRVNAKRRHGNG